MADATVLKTVGGNPVRVRIPSPAPPDTRLGRADTRPTTPTPYLATHTSPNDMLQYGTVTLP